MDDLELLEELASTDSDDELINNNQIASTNNDTEFMNEPSPTELELLIQEVDEQDANIATHSDTHFLKANKRFNDVAESVRSKLQKEHDYVMHDINKTMNALNTANDALSNKYATQYHYKSNYRSISEYDLLKRYKMYKYAAKNMKIKGDNLSAVKYLTDSKKIKKYIDQTRTGESVCEHIVPPILPDELWNINDLPQQSQNLEANNSAVATPDIIKNRIRNYKIMAVKAKKNGDIKNAKSYFKQFKEMEKMLDLVVSHKMKVTIDQLPKQLFVKFDDIFVSTKSKSEQILKSNKINQFNVIKESMRRIHRNEQAKLRRNMEQDPLKHQQYEEKKEELHELNRIEISKQAEREKKERDLKTYSYIITQLIQQIEELKYDSLHIINKPPQILPKLNVNALREELLNRYISKGNVDGIIQFIVDEGFNYQSIIDDISNGDISRLKEYFEDVCLLHFWKPFVETIHDMEHKINVHLSIVSEDELINYKNESELSLQKVLECQKQQRPPPEYKICSIKIMVTNKNNSVANNRISLQIGKLIQNLPNDTVMVQTKILQITYYPPPSIKQQTSPETEEKHENEQNNHPDDGDDNDDDETPQNETPEIKMIASDQLKQIEQYIASQIKQVKPIELKRDFSREIKIVSKCGWLQKQSKFFQTYRKRWIMLKGKCLYSYTDKLSTDHTEKFDLSEYNHIETVSENSNEFKLFTRNNKHNRQFMAFSNGSMSRWMNVIKIAQQNDIIKIPIKIRMYGGGIFDKFIICDIYSSSITIEYLLNTITKILNRDNYPKRYRIKSINKSSFLDILVSDPADKQIIKRVLTEFTKNIISTKGLKLSITLLPYHHKVKNNDVTCKYIEHNHSAIIQEDDEKLDDDKNALKCPVYYAMKINYELSQDNLDHMTEYVHFKDEYNEKDVCKWSQECRALVRLINGGNRLDDKCHIKLYCHPPRNNRQIKLSENTFGFIVNTKKEENFAIYSPTLNDEMLYQYNDKDGYLIALINEVIVNGYKNDLCLTHNDIENNQYSILNIVDEKMKHIRHLVMGKPLRSDEMLALILYTGCDCNYDLCSSQRNRNYEKWVWFDYCLYSAIKKLNRRETGEYKLYSGLNKVKLDKISLKCGYFPTYTSSTCIKSVAIGFMNGEGMILEIDNKFRNSSFVKCCDVSWISKFPDEYEILISRSDKTWNNNKFNLSIIDEINGVQTVSLKQRLDIL